MTDALRAGSGGEAGIPCMILTHGRDGVNRQSLDAVLNCDARLDVDIVDNPSVLEDGSFAEYARQLVTNGRIRSFTRFDVNISNNAVLLFLLDNLERYSNEYVILSDGDVIPPNGLVEEQIAILERHSDVFACGLRIDATSWSDTLNVKADLVQRFNTNRFETDDYVDSATGLWMTMFRGPELRLLLGAMVQNGIRFTDANLKRFGGILFEKKWVATKRSIGRELNREHEDYYDAKATSTTAFARHSPEPAGSRYSTWNHDIVADATSWQGKQDRRVVYPPLAPATPRFRGSIDNDPVVQALHSGVVTQEAGYVSRHSSQASRPGLAMVLADGKVPTGIPRLPGGRTILFISPDDAAGSRLYGLRQIDFDAALISWTAREAAALLQVFTRFLAEGGTMKGIAFHTQAFRSHIAQGKAPAPSHLPTAVRDAAARLAALKAAADDPAVNHLTAGLFTDEMISQFAERSGWSIRTSPPSPDRYFTYVQLKSGDATQTIGKRTAAS